MRSPRGGSPPSGAERPRVAPGPEGRKAAWRALPQRVPACRFDYESSRPTWNMMRGADRGLYLRVTPRPGSCSIRSFRSEVPSATRVGSLRGVRNGVEEIFGSWHTGLAREYGTPGEPWSRIGEDLWRLTARLRRARSQEIVGSGSHRVGTVIRHRL